MVSTTYAEENGSQKRQTEREESRDQFGRAGGSAEKVACGSSRGDEPNNTVSATSSP